jgi:hypothetical protein
VAQTCMQIAAFEAENSAALPREVDIGNGTLLLNQLVVFTKQRFLRTIHQRLHASREVSSPSALCAPACSHLGSPRRRMRSRPRNFKPSDLLHSIMLPQQEQAAETVQARQVLAMMRGTVPCITTLRDAAELLAVCNYFIADRLMPAVSIVLESLAETLTCTEVRILLLQHVQVLAEVKIVAVIADLRCCLTASA